MNLVFLFQLRFRYELMAERKPADDFVNRSNASFCVFQLQYLSMKLAMQFLNKQINNLSNGFRLPTNI